MRGITKRTLAILGAFAFVLGVAGTYAETPSTLTREGTLGPISAQEHLERVRRQARLAIQRYEQRSALNHASRPYTNQYVLDLGDLARSLSGKPRDWFGQSPAWYQATSEDPAPNPDWRKRRIAELRREADQGNAVAQRKLGQEYEHADPGEAVRWYRVAADQGDVLSRCLLGIMYYRGEGVPQDYAAAVQWLWAASDHYLCALWWIGEVYAASKNTIYAYAWWSVAAAKGSDDAREDRDDLYENMTGEEIATAQTIAGDL